MQSTEDSFEVGDTVEILGWPLWWNSLCGEEIPNSVKYPIRGKIDQKKDSESKPGAIGISLEGLPYGFSLNALIEKSMIKKITNTTVNTYEFY